MKTLFTLMALCSMAMAEPEKIFVVGVDAYNPDPSEIQRHLNAGWTVKAQSVVHSTSSSRATLIFTLSPPPPEVRAENARKAKEEFDRKRAEYLARKNGTEVERK